MKPPKAQPATTFYDLSSSLRTELKPPPKSTEEQDTQKRRQNQNIGNHIQHVNIKDFGQSRRIYQVHTDDEKVKKGMGGNKTPPRQGKVAGGGRANGGSSRRCRDGPPNGGGKKTPSNGGSKQGSGNTPPNRGGGKTPLDYRDSGGDNNGETFEGKSSEDEIRMAGACKAALKSSKNGSQLARQNTPSKLRLEAVKGTLFVPGFAQQFATPGPNYWNGYYHPNTNMEKKGMTPDFLPNSGPQERNPED
jgi:hypothetical protein